MLRVMFATALLVAGFTIQLAIAADCVNNCEQDEYRLDEDGPDQDPVYDEDDPVYDEADDYDSYGKGFDGSESAPDLSIP